PHRPNHRFPAMYAFQRYQVDAETGALTLDPADDLGPGFKLEPVWETRLATLRLGRISRITAITTDDGTETADPGFVPATPAETRTPEQVEQAKAAYLENWFKQLP
ncbi:MAG: hypothetical protein ACO3DQ_04500, partial [Cephaloticoccus sp.]